MRFSIHDPDVVFTDLGLAILAGWLAWRLGTAPGRGQMTKAGAVLLGGLASAAFWGAIFHAFFPEDTTTLPGFIAWIPVVLSILVVGATLLELSLRSPGAAARSTGPQVHRRGVRRRVRGRRAPGGRVVLQHRALLRPPAGPVPDRAVQQAIRPGSAAWTLIAVAFTSPPGGGAAAGSSVDSPGLLRPQRGLPRRPGSGGRASLPRVQTIR